MKTASIYITKASGEQVLFEVDKLRNSLSQAGAKPQVVEEIVKEVLPSLYPGIATGKIYQKAFSLLKRQAHLSAAKYKLKRALMELGPSGYPFEQFVGKILQYLGYEVQVGIYVEGHCISHEVDVLGEKDQQIIAVECKFGNTAGKKVDAKVALYIHSRFRDLAAAWQLDEQHRHQTAQGWIVTNASFTSDAIQYGTCAGLNLIAWDFPRQGSLKELIERSRLYPITTLTTLTKAEKQALIDQGFVLSKSLHGQDALLRKHRVPETRIRKTLIEVEELCDGALP